MIAVVSAAAVLGLSIVAVASGAAKVEKPFRGRGACTGLTSDPKALAAMQDLRAKHRAEMHAWFEKYGAGRFSAEAQAALKALREEHWNDMRALFERFDITGPGGTGPRSCGGGLGASRRNGGCGGAGGAQGSGYGGGMMGGVSY